MVKVLEFLDRHTARHLFRSSHLKVAGDTLGSSLYIYLKRMHEVQRLTSTSVRNIDD